MVERKCVLLCGGAGTRMLPLSLTMQKGMIKIGDKPIIRHLVEYWSWFCNEFIFVVNYRKNEIIEYVPSLGVKYTVVEIDHLRGIADGIYQVRNLTKGNFVVVLGDCVCRGDFDNVKFDEMGVGVIRTNREDDIRKSYSVEISASDPHRITRVVEKPKVLVNDLCGQGYYFFDHRVFSYIENTPASALRGEIEVTDVIQTMIEHGEYVRANMFTGKYINITFPDDIQEAGSFLPE